MNNPLFARASRDENGTAIVEAAVLVPFVIVVLLGVYAFAWLFYEQKLMATGIRDAARFVARTASASDSTCGAGGSPSLQTQAAYLATTGTTSAGGTVRVKGWTSDLVTFTCIAQANNQNYLGGDGKNIYVVQASTTNFVNSSDPIASLLQVLGLSTPGISISHQERVIGPG